VEEYIYRIALDADRVRVHDDAARTAAEGIDVALRRIDIDEDNDYHFVNPLPDPWYAALLRHPWGPAAWSVDVAVGDDLVADTAGRIEVTVGGLTDFGDAAPDHRVSLSLNGETIAEAEFDGANARRITAEVPAGLLAPGGAAPLADTAGPIEATVGGLAACGDAAPAPRVSLPLHGETIAEAEFDGANARRITAEVPAGLLAPGGNRVEVSLPGGTAAP